MRSKAISDHWKEKALPAYARNIFYNSLILLLTLALIFSPFIAAILLSIPMQLEIQVLLHSPAGLTVSTLFAIMYGYLRRRYAKK